MTTESPIEEDFRQAFVAMARATEIQGMSADEMKRRSLNEPGEIFIAPQVWVGKYRADFLVMATRKGWTRPTTVCVECDGKAFHSSSEQRRRDGVRDYFFACSDIHTIRFTGSRLWSDPFGCARDVLAELDVEKPTQRPIIDVIEDLIGANAIRNAARERDE